MNEAVNEHNQLTVGSKKNGLSSPVLAVRSMEEPDLRQLFATLWRRKWVILGTISIVTLIAGLYLSQLTPRYTAQTLIMIDSRGPHIISRVEAVVGELPGDTQALQSEMEVIRSRGLAEKVINHLQLDHNPESDDSQWIKSFLANVLDVKHYLPEGWLAFFKKFSSNEEDLSKEERHAMKRANAINAFLSSLSVSQKGQSRVIAVEFTSKDPRTAALMANTLADVYILEQRKAKFEATQGATDWLSERVTALQEKVATAETAVEQFRHQSGLLAGKGAGSGGKEMTLTSQQLSELNNQLILARASRSEAEARLSQANTLVNSPGGLEAAGDVLDSPLIQHLRKQVTEAERKIAERKRKYLIGQHPDTRDLQAEINDLKTVIKAEANRIIKSIENEVAVAWARETSLQTSLDELKAQAAQANTAEIRLRALEREAESNQRLLETYLSRLKETSSQEDFNVQQPDARIISRADVPNYPSFPNKKLIIVLAIIGSTFLGLLLIFVLENLQSGLRSSEQIERTMGVPALGLIPMVSRFVKRGKTPESYFLEQPRSAFAESIRTLYTSLFLPRADELPKKILIASAQPAEGKTTIAICLARMQALAGQKVIIIDADCRRPGIHCAFGIPREPGLVDLLAEEVSLEEVVRKDAASGADVIPAGRLVSNLPNILASEHMDRFLDKLVKDWDLIILDSPPIFAVSDACILSQKADMTILVVRWAHTKRQGISLALKQIATSKGNLAGVALSMVDVKKHARYGYADSGTYFGRLKRYYVG